MNQLQTPACLTSDEADFVYRVEVLGLPARKAAELAGMPLSKINAPHIIQARELAKRELRGAVQITKEDVVFGMREAVDRARLLAEPMTEIVGWKEIAKLLGYDQPTKIDVNITASIEVQREHVKHLSDAELASLLDAGKVIDGDFYRVGD